MNQLFTATFLFLFIGFTSCSSYSVINTTPNLPFFTVINVDQNSGFRFQITDQDVTSVKFRLISKTTFGSTSNLKSSGSDISYTILKCGKNIFNGSTSQQADFVIEFSGQWVPMMLNGTCGSRELIFIMNSPAPSKMVIHFEKIITTPVTKNIGYPWLVNLAVKENQKLDVDGLEGLLKLASDRYLTVYISSVTGASFEMGVCNSTIFNINEEIHFTRQLKSDEIEKIEWMRDIHCENATGDITNYHIKNLGNQELHLTFMAAPINDTDFSSLFAVIL